MNIVLIGFMGSGKTAVGKLLSRRLGRPFYDTDEMIEKQTGMKIPEIFAATGEPSFRDMEAQAIRLVGLLENAVISTGGGAPMREENMEELERNGVLFCLSARPETLVKRLKNETVGRPLLKGPDPLQAIEELLGKRAKAYARARHTIATDGLGVEQVADEILKHVTL